MLSLLLFNQPLTLPAIRTTSTNMCVVITLSAILWLLILTVTLGRVNILFTDALTVAHCVGNLTQQSSVEQ